ncbi:Cof-type HAD-IIB family hydrolase [Treponema primitia]|uniref:Cof-type HAD-IIB family hydrolase n=1 Tax=Treponema primitia TaxID=88058 RepID=UPI00397F4C92
MKKQLNSAAIKALALDLDGTALGLNAEFTGRTIGALRACISRGIQVILCTGRAVEGAEKHRAAIGAEGPMVYFNGAEVVDMPEARVLSAGLMDLAVVDFCIDISRSMGVHYQVFFPAAAGSREILMIEKYSAEAEMYQKHTSIVPVIGDLKEAIAKPGLSGCIKGMFIAESAVQDLIRPKLTARFGNSMYMAQTFPTFLEIMRAGVSKGEGLRFAMKQRGLKAEEVIALGNEENDLPMFNAVGFSVAPANSRESVCAAADLVIGSNEEEGVAAFLEEFLLN